MEIDSHPSELEDDISKSLIVPITSTSSSSASYIEIFDNELNEINPSLLAKVLKDEDSSLSTWSDAALLYVSIQKEAEAMELLNIACEDGLEGKCGNREHRVRLLASAGITALTLASTHTSKRTSASLLPEEEDEGEKGAAAERHARVEELRTTAESRFTRATKVDQFFPMTWMGRGMHNLALGRLDQARFFFDTILKQCGQVLPALLGMAAVKYAEENYKAALELYGKAITLFPHKAGAPARVGLALSCYKLNQIDRAKAAFRRALALDEENVQAMLGLSLLEMASIDETSRYYRSKTEQSIKLISMANLIDQNNAMVQNHLANHYFWKWTPLPGFVSVKHSSAVLSVGNNVALEVGDRIRVGTDFETSVVVERKGRERKEGCYSMKDVWKDGSQTNLKLWKKDYDRVLTLAKNAYNSTSVTQIQAESLFLLARVFHIRNDEANALKYYDRACKLAPNLSPARFGLAQTLVWEEHYDQAAAHLKLVLGTSANATDALALLGLLEVKNNTAADRKSAFTYLKKAIDLDPLNPDLVLLEALALQQQESDYSKSLEKYKKAIELMEVVSPSKKIPFEVLTNMGVLCHETKKLEEAIVYYGRALQALDEDKHYYAPFVDWEYSDDEDDENNTTSLKTATLDKHGDVDGGIVRHADNHLFWVYVDVGVTLKVKEGDETVLIVVEEKEDDEENDAALSPLEKLSVGDFVRIGNDFESEVKALEQNSIVIAKPYPKSEEEKEEQVKIHVKRGNRRLCNPPAISVAFNLARLHESAGRIIPAVELHKAIVKRHPAYVNSYLRLACISRDCGSLHHCSEWLKAAMTVAPGNPEVLTLVGNLHLSLCDWAPAQSVFDQLLSQKVPNVEAYAMLSLGNIYFNNLKTPKKYSKHLQYAADLYKRILTKDKANAYAANGLGTVLAEKGELFKAKEVFHRVREVSGDTILDTLLNLGHIYLAQKKHPEALQMYQSYRTRTRSTGAPITSKSQDDDDAEVLLYIAFAYFDWARQTELFNDARAAPADERYKKCTEFIELAMKKSRKENVLLRYNWCMTKLHAANCVLQKLTRNIRRTAQEVQDALNGLEESLPYVQTFLQWKTEKKRIPITTSMLNDFVAHCKANIESAKSHLGEELKKESEAREFREMQRIEAASKEKEKEIEMQVKKEKEARKMEAREYRARAKMEKVNALLVDWDLQEQRQKAENAKKRKEGIMGDAPLGTMVTEDGIYDTGVNQAETRVLFGGDIETDSDDDDFDPNKPDEEEEKGEDGSKSGKEDSDEDDVPAETEKTLFGDDSSSSDESDDELVPTNKKKKKSKRGDDDEGGDNKRRRVMEDE